MDNKISAPRQGTIEIGIFEVVGQDFSTLQKSIARGQFVGE